MIKGLIRAILRNLRKIFRKIKDIVKLVSLLPELYRIYLTNSESPYTYNYQVRYLVDELKKICIWHSNFLGLIDFWQYDSEFNSIFQEVSKVRGNYITRCFMLYQFLKLTDGLRGGGCRSWRV